MSRSVFTHKDDLKLRMLSLGLRVPKTKWSSSVATRLVFGDGYLDDWSENKVDFPQFSKLGTEEAFDNDMAALYDHVKVVVDEALIKLSFYGGGMRYTDFVQYYDDAFKEMQTLRFGCSILADYEKRFSS